MRPLRYLGLSILLMLTLSVQAERTPGFSMSAFNLAVPGSGASAVFSPFAFELDAVVVSEAMGPLEKAKYVETLGALIGYENIYRPIAERYHEASSNDFELVSARAYLASSLRMVAVKYRTYVQEEYGVQTCPTRPDHLGAESYFKAAMDGTMEDFRLPSAALVPKGVSFVDLESFAGVWAEAFPTNNTKLITFTSETGRQSEVKAMADVREADLWTTPRFTMLRLPMADGAFFYAVLPSASNNLASIRGEFAAEKFNTALTVTRSLTEEGLYRGKVSLVLPVLALDSSVNLAPVFAAFALPIGGFKEIENSGRPLDVVSQRTRFVLDERGVGGTSPAGRQQTADRRFLANRPFLFFIYHEPTRTVPVAGIYAGENP